MINTGSTARLALPKLHDGPRAPIRIRRADLEQYIADRRANQTRDAVAAEKRRRAAR